MKNLAFKSLILLFMMISLVSCEKENNSIGNTTVTISASIKYIKSISRGGQGGLTFYKSNLGGKNNGGIDDGLFISQYPLIEYRYIQNVQYDSLATFVIDTITNDTLSTTYEILEIKRDTLGFEKGPLWLPLDERNFSKIYVGLKKQYLDTTLFAVRMNMIDTIPVEGNGLLFTGLYNHDESLNASLVENDSVNLEKGFYKLTDSIPMFDNFGEIVGYQSGIEIGSFLTRNFQIAGNQGLTRKFRLTFYTHYGSEVSSEFEITFVPYEIYLQRLCWLNQEIGCEDLFEE